MLCERRELSVIYLETGKRFTITLRDWQGMLWAVRVHPSKPTPVDLSNPFVTKHRILNRTHIEDWLQRLRLARTKPAGPLATSRATSPATRTGWTTRNISSASSARSSP